MTEVTVRLKRLTQLGPAIKKTGIEDPTSVTHLIIRGEISQNEFDYIKAKMNDTLEVLDLSNVTVSECDYVFKLGFSRLTTCILPDALQCDTIDLGWCPRLTTIRIHPDNPVYTSENGVLLSKDKTRLVCFPRGWQ